MDDFLWGYGMNRLRKVLFLLVGLAIVTFALPGIAGNDKKMFGLTMSVPENQTPPPFVVVATVTNEGNSTISSFAVSLPPVASPLTIVGVIQPASGAATVAPDGLSVSVKNMRPLKSGQAFAVTILVNTCGDAQWSASAWTGSSLNGQSFALDVANSSLVSSGSCGDAVGGQDFAVPNSINTNCSVSGQRGAYDKDGGTPTTIPYFVTDTVPHDGLLHFRWPVDASGGPGAPFDPNAAFEYTITCPFGPFPQTLLAWFNKDGTRATGTSDDPDFIDADTIPACLPVPFSHPPAAGLPVPYGALVSSIDDSTTTITVNAVDTDGAIAHDVPPFDVIIGTERMTVIQVASDDGPGGDLSDSSESTEDETEIETWTVIRHVGGTKAAGHNAGSLVMYTPLPIMTVDQGVAPGGPEYKAGDQALMCIAGKGDNGSEGHPATTHSTTVIDIGDSHIAGP
jgi:hypothetical protein